MSSPGGLGAPQAVHVDETGAAGEESPHLSQSRCHYCVSVSVTKYNGICLADLSCMQATLSRLTHGPEEQEGKMHGHENGPNKIYSH